MIGHYIVDEDYNPIACESVEEWTEFWANNHDKRAFRRTRVDTFKVYTSFLTIDHAWGDMEPQLFETMICNELTGEWLNYQTRCYGPKEADQQHRLAIKLLKSHMVEK